MSDNIAMFEQIRALSEVSWEQADALAREHQLVVKTREGWFGVLTGVDFTALAEVEIEQRSRTIKQGFAGLTATGHRHEVAS